MKPQWAIQKFALNDEDGQGMSEAFDLLGLTCHILNIPPFDYDHPVEPVDYDGPVIPYGGTKFIDSIKDDDNWFCVFNDDFTYRKAIDELGDRMFNHDAKFMKMKDFNGGLFRGQEYVFIRPDKDTKEFAGNVMHPTDFSEWKAQVEGKGWGVNDDTEILVAEASRLDEEWRMYVVDNTVVSGSRYRNGHCLSISPDVPKEVYDYVYDAISVWQPAPFFVMDICRVSDSYSILEIGDLHSAGWYASDKLAVIKAISDYADKVTV